MQFKNIHIILTFITLALQVLSSPVDINTKETKEIQNNVNGAVGNILNEVVTDSSSDEETIIDADVSPVDDEDSELTEVEEKPEPILEKPEPLPEKPEPLPEKPEPLPEKPEPIPEKPEPLPEKPKHYIETLTPNNGITMVEENMYITEFKGDYGLDQLLASNYTSKEIDSIAFALKYMYPDLPEIQLTDAKIELACSSFQVPNEKGDGYYFGRNYDWGNSPAIIVVSHPENGYSSISTASKSPIDILTNNTPLPDFILQAIAIYAPIDGVNEKGLTVSVNMVGDNTKPADQDTERPEITLTVGIRTLLDKAATVDEALAILEKYDMHSVGVGIEFHYHITDAQGNSVVVEYIGNEIVKIYDNVNENFYLTELNYETGYVGYRYQIIKDTLAKKPSMSIDDVRDTLASVTQDWQYIFTEWSVIYDQKNIEATFYHHSNFEHGYLIKL